MHFVNTIKTHKIKQKNQLASFLKQNLLFLLANTIWILLSVTFDFMHSTHILNINCSQCKGRFLMEKLTNRSISNRNKNQNKISYDLLLS